MMRIAFLNRETLSFHAAALILGAAAFLSKALGLVRDRLLAARFGAGEELDIYYAAFQIPDLLYTVLLAAAASAAVLPVFLEHDRRGPAAAGRFLSNLLTVFSAVAAAIGVIAWLLAPWLFGFVAPGFDEDQAARAVGLTRIMLANTAFLGIAGILSAVLQARRRFFVFALPPIVYNLGIIAGILLAAPRFGLVGLAYGVIAGGILQVLMQVPAMRAIGFKFRFSFSLADAGLRRVAAMSLPRVIALAMTQFTLTVLTAIASYFAAGSISVFRFAVNLLYVPVGLFGVSWALAIFPRLSSAFLAGERESFRQQIAVGIRSILFWTLPAASLAIVLRAHIVRVVLGSGFFDWEDTRLVAALVAVIAIAIISECLLPLFLRAFYALGRTREPLIWDIAGSAVTIGAAFMLGGFFAARPETLLSVARVLRIGDLPQPSILAIGMAFAFGSIVNIILLGRSLKRVARRELGISLSFEANGLLVMLGASVLAGVAAYIVLLPFPALLPTNTLAGIFLQGAAAGMAGMLVYALILVSQKNPEMLAIIQSFRQRLLNPAKTPRVFETEKLDGNGVK